MSAKMIDHQQRRFLPAAGHDLFLPLYDPVLRLFGGERARRDLVDQASIEPQHRILDIGCGTGTLVLMLKRQYARAKVVGLDPDEKALRRAKAKARRASVSVQFDPGFADRLPYEGGSFDRVFSSFMFHHLEEEERERTLREVLRVLKPGGSFHLLDFAADHGPHGLWARLIHSHARLKDNVEERILELMTRAGFKNPATVKNGSMFFGLLRTAYFLATAR